jgi:hypothetical protein
MKKLLSAAALLFTVGMTGSAYADIANINTQQTCTQTGSDSAPINFNGNSTWRAGGLNRNLDRQVYGKNIVAYKILWSNGWSDWYVKGVNDLYSLTTSDSSNNAVARLTWIYFFDHSYQYISCS